MNYKEITICFFLKYDIIWLLNLNFHSIKTCREDLKSNFFKMHKNQINRYTPLFLQNIWMYFKIVLNKRRAYFSKRSNAYHSSAVVEKGTLLFLSGLEINSLKSDNSDNYRLATLTNRTIAVPIILHSTPGGSTWQWNGVSETRGWMFRLFSDGERVVVGIFQAGAV